MENVKKKKIGFFEKLYVLFKPMYIYKSVEAIPFSLLEKENIKLVMLDMDNTLIDKELNYTRDLVEWIDRLKRENIKIYILSNSLNTKVVKSISKKLGIKYHNKAIKPLKGGFKYILEKEKVKPQNTLMIGDQLFTDVFGGNRVGVKTVLVNIKDKNERLHTKLKRPLERKLLNYITKRESGKK